MIGTGFLETPADPARATAKPMVRLIEPPNQFFDERLTVGVAAFANNMQSGVNGVAAIRFHFEGNVLEVAEPSLRDLEREDGSTYQCLGYWAELQHSGTDGHAHLYVEAIPMDPAMQSRVIGPYQYSPSRTLHDVSCTVGAAGDFSNIRDALLYLRAQTAQNPLVTLLDDATYPLAGGSSFIGEGYCTIRPAPGVEATLSLPSGNEGLWRPKYDRLWFEGVTFDLSTVSAIWNEGNGDHVFKNCRLIRTGGRALWFRNVPSNSFFARNNAWFLENTMLGIYEPGDGASLLRGNVCERGWGDWAGNAFCTLHNVINDWRWTDIASDTEGRLRIQYSGSGSNVTLSRTGFLSGPASGRYRRFILKVDGTPVLTFDAWQDWSRHDEGDARHTVQDFANAINALPDFTATVLSNAIAARALNLQDSTSNDDFGDTEIGTDYTLVADLDLHTDAFANGSATNNIIHVFNKATGFEGQLGIFGAGGTTDMAFIGNVLGTGEDAISAAFTRFEGTQHRHTMFAHNSSRGQRVLIDGDSAFDAYSFVSNNAAPEIRDLSGTVVGANNLVADGANAHFGLTSTMELGTSTSWYIDAANGDFRPAGALLANLRLSLFRFDPLGRPAISLQPVGAPIG